MNYIAGVEVLETFGDIGQLVRKSAWDERDRRDTNKCKPVYIRVLIDVLPEIPVRHPIQNELEGSGSNSQQGNDVWMFQVSPRYGFLAERLRVSSVITSEENDGVNNTLR